MKASGATAFYFGLSARVRLAEAVQSSRRGLPPCGGYFARRVSLLAIAAALLCAGQVGGATNPMQPATTAPPLPLPQITLRTPLVSLDVARAALRMTTNEVMALIDARRLRYCFNVAVEIIYRREVRILANSLAHYQRGARTRFGDGDELQAVIRMIFPMAPAPRFGVVSTLRATTIARQLSLKTDTVLALLDAGWLRSPTNSERHPGPTGSPAIEFSSVVEFLKKRRIV